MTSQHPKSAERYLQVFICLHEVLIFTEKASLTRADMIIKNNTQNSMLSSSFLKYKIEIDHYAHFSSNTEKSETRSHTLSPLRAALEEYAGPMPFLVVPKL